MPLDRDKHLLVLDSEVKKEMWRASSTSAEWIYQQEHFVSQGSSTLAKVIPIISRYAYFRALAPFGLWWAGGLRGVGGLDRLGERLGDLSITDINRGTE